MHMLEEKIRTARKHGRTALIPFVTAGFPDRERFWQILRELDESGADILEIGVPFSDPVADGPVVAEASRRSLALGVNLPEILKELGRIRPLLKAGIVLMGYFNPFLQYGLERLARDAAAAGVNGFIVPDLPYEEAGPLRELLEARGMALVPLAGANTPASRMALYAAGGQGYAYVVSVMGTTGARAALPPEVADTLARARQHFQIPLALGFGLHSPEQLQALPQELRPDAVVFGSSLLSHLDAGGSAAAFLARWQ